MAGATQLPTDEPPPYSPPITSSQATRPAPRDPRSSSTQSLVTAGSHNVAKRNLLLVYLHGFMGSETSFQSFPAHVHNMVSALLSESHAVHTKVYPRYRSKKNIQVASNDLSTWLQPHEGLDTDIILLGHSMGGLLAADTVLLPSDNQSASPLRHTILGTINLDTPFLGLHPGIIKAGLSSLFRSNDTPPSDTASEDQDTGGSDLMPQDPNFNPAFFNDNHLPVRSAWRNAAHFVNKHSTHLRVATKQLITSHVEFGGCLADFDGLKQRYCRIRMLEEEHPEKRRTVFSAGRVPPRTRFANYYTSSTGRPKKDDSSSSHTSQNASVDLKEKVDDASDTRSVSTSTTLAAHSYPADLKNPVPVDESDSESDTSNLSDLDPTSMTDLESNFDEVELPNNTDNAAVPPYQPSMISDASTVESISPGQMPYPASQHQQSFGVAQEQRAYPPEKLKLEAPASTYSASSQDMSAVDMAREAYEREQAAMLPEPEPIGPPPSMNSFDDIQKYREALSQHGRASQQYFEDARAHQKEQFDRFVAESKARSEVLAKQLADIHVAIGEEAKRYSEGLGENARIVAEINREAYSSLINHKQLVADCQRRMSNMGLSTLPMTKAQERLEKVRQRLSERQEKIDRKLAKHREKLERDRLKTERKIGKLPMRMALSPVTPTVETSRGLVLTGPSEVFFDALDRPGEKSPAYDPSSAPIAETIHPVRSYSSSVSSLDSGGIASRISSEADRGRSVVLSPPTSELGASPGSSTPARKKERMFCTLPPADGAGQRDHTWRRIHMENMDEVSAHTSLFIARNPSETINPGQAWSERYSKFVCDVAECIELWVGEEMSRRMVEGLSEAPDS